MDRLDCHPGEGIKMQSLDEMKIWHILCKYRMAGTIAEWSPQLMGDRPGGPHFAEGQNYPVGKEATNTVFIKDIKG